MKQYRITSSNFVTPGESLEPDAYLDPADLENVKKQSGNYLPFSLFPQTESVNVTLIREQKFDDVTPKKLLG